MNNVDTAKQILDIVGKDNITYVTHCATRLRFNVKNEEIVNLKAIDKVEGVLKSQFKSGQLQVVIGAKVEGVFNEVIKMVDLSGDVKIEKTERKKI